VREDSEPRAGGQLPQFPARAHDRERLDRAERQDRLLSWLARAVSLTLNLITFWY
jgi:hypothetical protein